MRVTGMAGAGILAVVVVGACDSLVPEPVRGEAVRQECPAVSSDDFFFPPGIVAPNEEHDRNQRQAYSRSLRLADGASLSCGPLPVEAYRLQHWSYFRRTVVISVSRHARGWVVEGTELSADGYPPVQVVRRVQHPIGDVEVEALKNALARGHFWTAPRWVETSLGGGPPWAIEGRADSRYRILTRYDGDPSFAEAARSFFTLARLPAPHGLRSP